MSTLSSIGVFVAGLFFIGFAKGALTLRFLQRATRVRARVVDRIDASNENDETSSQSASVVRYVAEVPGSTGSRRRVPLAHAFGGSMAEHLVDAAGTIPVVYDPKRPDIVYIDKPWALYFGTAFLCAPAVIFLLLIAYVRFRA